jgi:diadenylate cyclase
MPDFLAPTARSIPHLTPIAVIDIVLVAFLIYQFLLIVRGRRAAHILIGIAVLVLAYFVADYFGLELLRTILARLAPYAPFALIVMFQSEIRRLLARIGRRRWISLGSRLQRRELSDDLVLAIIQLSKNQTGALIVIERDIGLRTFIESGILLDATLSPDLLLTIFQPGSALHDGAVIVQGDKIASAACFLPLTVKPGLASQLGTRHRAAIGVTEEADCLAIVVSEETGRISIASLGEIELDVSDERLEQRVAEYMGQRRAAASRKDGSLSPRVLDRRVHDAHSD